MKKLGFVIPWYAEDIPGGAESELRGLVNHLYDRGVELEVITTCVEKFVSDWSRDFYPEGLDTKTCHVPVRRFKVRKRDNDAFREVNRLLMAGKRVSPQQEQIYMREMINSPALCEYIREHKDEYSLFVFIPYMFGTSYNGTRECFEKAVYIPCFHDESYAYMGIFKELYPKVRAMMFNAPAEQRLANRLYDLENVEQMVLGVGIDTDRTPDPAAFREKFNIKEPFILYAGRKTAGKRVDLLLTYFNEYKKTHDTDLKLVLIGGDTIEIPAGIKNDVYDLGFVDIQDKWNAYGAAELLCQPSPFESFSIVIMESWVCERPVLVSGACEVTKEFAQMSGGGLYFNDYPEFAGCLDYLSSHKETADMMGRNGREFVMDNFSWDAILKKAMDFLEKLDSETAGETA